MAKVRVVLNRGAVAALLKSPEVEADLLARAKRIATLAGAGMEPASMIGRNRARAEVLTATPQAKAAEAKSRRLSSSIQAGG